VLTETDREMLEFAGLRWKHEGLREQAVRDRFQLSLTRYEQRMNALIDQPEALMHAPQTVNRLRRLRAARRHTYRAS
jgi:hypothetical protein